MPPNPNDLAECPQNDPTAGWDVDPSQPPEAA
jgi:hypothetical protein